MIDPKELRIGNLVLVHGVKLSEPKTKVLAIDKVVAQSCRNYDPIPITPEWLERFGFEKNHISSDMNFLVSIYPEYYGGISLYFDLNSDGLEILITTEHDTDECMFYPLKGIKHVHQLQNLFHSLTGQELK